jgi:hypothetical protein
MRAFSPGSAALLGHITRPGESAETLRPLIIEDQLTESTLSYVDGLRQAPLADKSIRQWGRTAGVGQGMGSGLAITQSAFSFTHYPRACPSDVILQDLTLTLTVYLLNISL